jgi:hypothetical protein
METERPAHHLAGELEVKARMHSEWERKFGYSVSSKAPSPN